MKQLFRHHDDPNCRFTYHVSSPRRITDDGKYRSFSFFLFNFQYSLVRLLLAIIHLRAFIFPRRTREYLLGFVDEAGHVRA